MGFFSKIKQGLEKTKNSIDEKINNVFSNFRKVDEELLEELEEILIMSDFGMETSINIINELRNKVKKEKIEDEENVKQSYNEREKSTREECGRASSVTDHRSPVESSRQQGCLAERARKAISTVLPKGSGSESVQCPRDGIELRQERIFYKSLHVI